LLDNSCNGFKYEGFKTTMAIEFSMNWDLPFTR
jgi:hypothetical protein